VYEGEWVEGGDGKEGSHEFAPQKSARPPLPMWTRVLCGKLARRMKAGVDLRGNGPYVEKTDGYNTRARV